MFPGKRCPRSLGSTPPVESLKRPAYPVEIPSTGSSDRYGDRRHAARSFKSQHAVRSPLYPQGLVKSVTVQTNEYTHSRMLSKRGDTVLN